MYDIVKVYLNFCLIRTTQTYVRKLLIQIILSTLLTENTSSHKAYTSIKFGIKISQFLKPASKRLNAFLRKNLKRLKLNGTAPTMSGKGRTKLLSELVSVCQSVNKQKTLCTTVKSTTCVIVPRNVMWQMYSNCHKFRILDGFWKIRFVSIIVSFKCHRLSQPLRFSVKFMLLKYKRQNDKHYCKFFAVQEVTK
jgi:hypothetical protein